MPQLNPGPWFFIMTASWLTLSLIIQPKLVTFISANPPSNPTSKVHKTTPWNWPWT
uniref:ATP synthase F0 subunit 8 n=1 Tax=Cinclus pallasii TaxID=245049 RepID=UPI0028FCCE08|nr:ATP synthase F0 subunit 8 [Cinclus pallasii]UDF84458.1 ATP synthase F0 subunit 8 [Cinclus pallasii]